MSVVDGGVTYGCTDALEDQAYGIAYAGRDLARVLLKGGTLPAKYTIAGVVYDVTGITGLATDGATSSQTALAAAIGASRGGTPTLLVLPPADNHYRYTNVLDFSPNTYLVGYGAKVKPLQDDKWRFNLKDNCGLFGLRMDSTYNSMSRWVERHEADRTVEGAKDGSISKAADDGWTAAWANILDVSDCILMDCSMTGSLTGALRLASATNCLVEGNSSFRTHSDSFHLVKDSSFITARNNKIYDSGDDCISVIQYADSTGIPRNMLIEGNVAKGGRGRGYVVVSGQDILFRDNIAEDINMAGYRFGPATAHSINDTKRIKVQRCQAWRCAEMQSGQNNSSSGGAIVSTVNYKCTDVTFTDCVGHSWGDDYYKGAGFLRQKDIYTGGGSGITGITTTNCSEIIINQSQ